MAKTTVEKLNNQCNIRFQSNCFAKFFEIINLICGLASAPTTLEWLILTSYFFINILTQSSNFHAQFIGYVVNSF